MSLRLSPSHIARIRAHGEATYPHECCGILLGKYTSGEKLVAELRELSNEREESRHNRFLISPGTMMRAELEARALNLDIVGFYHSHPDAPARPSEFDREHAWPTYSYAIVSVEMGKARDVTSWLLSEDRSRFEPEELARAVEV